MNPMGNNFLRKGRIPVRKDRTLPRLSRFLLAGTLLFSVSPASCKKEDEKPKETPAQVEKNLLQRDVHKIRTAIWELAKLEGIHFSSEEERKALVKKADEKKKERLAWEERKGTPEYQIEQQLFEQHKREVRREEERMRLKEARRKIKKRKKEPTPGSSDSVLKEIRERKAKTLVILGDIGEILYRHAGQPTGLLAIYRQVETDLKDAETVLGVLRLSGMLNVVGSAGFGIGRFATGIPDEAKLGSLFLLIPIIPGITNASLPEPLQTDPDEEMVKVVFDLLRGRISEKDLQKKARKDPTFMDRLRKTMEDIKKDGAYLHQEVVYNKLLLAIYFTAMSAGSPLFDSIIEEDISAWAKGDLPFANESLLDLFSKIKTRLGL